LCEAWYDNSEKNLANPDPTRTVRWGEQTWDEMMIGYFSSVRLDEVPQTGAPPSSKSSPSSPKSF
jgi:hypothetical protein